MSIQEPTEEEFLSDVLTTMIESGGSNYWIEDILELHYGPPTVWERELGLSNGGVSSFLIKADDGTGKVREYRVDAAELKSKGFDAVAMRGFKVNSRMRGTILAARVDRDAGEIDADAADVLLQAVCFGELVYG